MRTAIFLPDDTYERAERTAKRLGINRSQFYAAAAERYIAELESAEVTDAINAVVNVANDDTSARIAVAAGARLLEAVDDEW